MCLKPPRAAHHDVATASVNTMDGVYSASAKVGNSIRLSLPLTPVMNVRTPKAGKGPVPGCCASTSGPFFTSAHARTRHSQSSLPCRNSSANSHQWRELIGFAHSLRTTAREPGLCQTLHCRCPHAGDPFLTGWEAHGGAVQT